MGCVMLYPNISNIKRNNVLIRSLLLATLVLAMLLVGINYATKQSFPWSLLCIAGMIYVWVTTIYAIKKTSNIGLHVMLQMVFAIFILMIVDYAIGFQGWSIKIGLPIAIIVANLSMILLTIVSPKKYYRYTVYQLIIFGFTVIILVLNLLKCIPWNILFIIAESIGGVSLVISFLLCGKGLMQEMKKIFHI